MLCERDDMASHTSSASTKLIHGGLRYLEYYEFSLVRKALHEREVLLRAAPHIIWPLRFVMPHDKTMRPAWFIRLGLFFYDNLARRELLPGCEGIALNQHPAGVPLKAGYSKAFVYSDAWVMDARLTVLNAVDAKARGARIAVRTELVAARRKADYWELDVQNAQGERETVTARLLVNAAGPWVSQILKDVIKVDVHKSVRLVKGSHMVVPKMFDHDHAYIFQNPDKRIIFAIPYEQDFTLIGTTDLEYKGDPRKVEIDASEVDYLCQMASRYFKKTITPKEVVWSYSGVRPLLDDASGNASSVTRDYALELDTSAAPILSIFGGKLTTYRKLAEEVVEKIQPLLGNTQPTWTAHQSLPGGDIERADFKGFFEKLCTRYPSIPSGLLERLARHYGTRVDKILGQAKSVNDLGEQILPGLYEAEVRYLLAEEFAATAEDILWRRTKLGLHLPADAQARLDEWIASHQH